MYNKRNSRETKYDKEFALGRAEGIRVCSQQDALVCRIAQDVLKKTTWSTSGAAASACRDALDLAEYTRAVWCQVVVEGEVLLDEWKEEHNYRLLELVRLADRRSKRT